TVKVWDLAEEQGVLTLRAPNRERGVLFTPDGKLATVSGRTSPLLVWDGATGHEVQTLLKDLSDIVNMTLSPDGKRLAGVVRSRADAPPGGKAPPKSLNTVKLWDTARRIEIKTLAMDRDDRLSNWILVFSPDGKRLATAASSMRGGGTNREPGTIQVWDAASGK